MRDLEKICEGSHLIRAASLVLDTHAAIWYLQEDPQLSYAARMAIRSAIRSGLPVYVPSVSLVEITYLVEKGRVPLDAFQKLRGSLTDPPSGFVIAALDLAVVDALGFIPRHSIPDLPDRVVAATALALGVPLVSRDRKIRASDVETIW